MKIKQSKAENDTNKLLCSYVKMGDKGKLIFNFLPFKRGRRIKWLIIVLCDWANKHDDGNDLTALNILYIFPLDSAALKGMFIK